MIHFKAPKTNLSNVNIYYSRLQQLIIIRRQINLLITLSTTNMYNNNVGPFANRFFPSSK